MPQGYEVSGPQMLAASKDVFNIHGETKGYLDHLRRNLEPLRDNAWKGQAATAFNQLMDRFNSASEKLLLELHSIGERLNEGAKEYGVREDEASRAVTQAGSGIDTGRLG